jgi:outer membrane lipoprotein carrier protein
MRTHVVGICVLVVALVPRPGVGAPNVDEIVRRVQTRYDATRDFTADVKQEMLIASLGKTTTATGTVAFKKPGKMRWELTQGDPQVIVADGTTLWLYQPKEQQVLKAPFDAAFRSTTPISFLTGVGRIAEDFQVSIEGDGAGGGQPAATGPADTLVHLLLVPRRDAASVGRLRLTVTRDSGDIRGAEIQDPLGNISRLSFDHVRRNVGLADDQFVFHVPPGVDVITAPPAQ